MINEGTRERFCHEKVYIFLKSSLAVAMSVADASELKTTPQSQIINLFIASIIHFVEHEPDYHPVGARGVLIRQQDSHAGLRVKHERILKDTIGEYK